MDQYTRYCVNQSGGGEIGPVYMASFRVQRGKVIGSFFRGLFQSVKPLLFTAAKALGREALKAGSNIITDIINNEPEQPVGNFSKLILFMKMVSLKKRLK
jgi:hypothetical protein